MALSYTRKKYRWLHLANFPATEASSEDRPHLKTLSHRSWQFLNPTNFDNNWWKSFYHAHHHIYNLSGHLTPHRLWTVACAYQMQTATSENGRNMNKRSIIIITITTKEQLSTNIRKLAQIKNSIGVIYPIFSVWNFLLPFSMKVHFCLVCFLFSFKC